MAEYYPLLAKAVGSLPNSTPESRRVVYERARKALIGQLRTLHPPVPDEDIDRESTALDRAIERVESEIAADTAPGPVPAGDGPEASGRPVLAAASPAPAPPASPEAVLPAVAPPPAPEKPAPETPAPLVALTTDNPAATPPVPAEKRPTFLRTKAPQPPADAPSPLGAPSSSGAPSPAVPPAPRPASLTLPGLKVPTPSAAARAPFVNRTAQSKADTAPESLTAASPLDPGESEDTKRSKPPKSDLQRPIAPQPPAPRGPKRRLWVIPVAVGLVVAVVAYAAWKLRDHPELVARSQPPAEKTPIESGKIAERVGDAGAPAPAANAPEARPTPAQTAPAQTAPVDQSPQPGPKPQPGIGSPNPELPVAHRAALLVEAPSEPNKVKTFLGSVVWKLNNAPQGPNDAVGVAVEADIDLPDDKMKAVVTFAKNTEASLPASHTINVRFSIDPGSFTGDVKQISVPQMRPEASPSGEPLAGVTVQIVPNSFLVGLSPGNAETANTDLMRRLQWIDIPMLLDSGKIAKLTFEKGDSGQRDIDDALDAWQKQ